MTKPIQQSQKRQLHQERSGVTEEGKSVLPHRWRKSIQEACGRDSYFWTRTPERLHSPWRPGQWAEFNKQEWYL